MSQKHTTTRRTALKAGIASLASAAVITPEGHAAMPQDIKPKAPGETKVVFLGGDMLHNFSAQEPALRSICEGAGWKFYAVHDARYCTPGLISDADLMFIQRWVGGVPGWVPGPVFEEAPKNDGYMSEELENTVYDNVVNRGMGFVSLHCTIWAMSMKKFTGMLGIRAIIHGPLQAVRVFNFNQDHPITRGMKEFDIAIDENFGVELINPKAVRLYETFGYSDKRHDIGGWCIEQGNGRIAGFTAGHTYFAYEDPSHLRMLRRAAFWVLKRDIPPDRD